ncbi:SHORTAGE IN CHIASMATA 1-like protein [Drosera capensis]
MQGNVQLFSLAIGAHCAQLPEANGPFENFIMLDIDVFNISEAFSYIKQVDKIETLTDVEFKSFEGLIVCHELAVADDSFKSLPVPVIVDDERAWSLQTLAADVLSCLDELPGSASDEIYLDWHLLGKDKCNCDFSITCQTAFNDTKPYSVDLTMLFHGDDGQLLGFDSPRDSLSRIATKEDRLSLISGGSCTLTEVSVGRLSLLSKTDHLNVEATGRSANTETRTAPSVDNHGSQFNDLEFFLNPQKPTVVVSSNSGVKVSNANTPFPGGLHMGALKPSAGLSSDVLVHELNLSANLLALLSNFQTRHVSASLVKDDFDIVLEYGGPYGTSVFSNILPNSSSQFLFFKMKLHGAAEALCQGVGTALSVGFTMLEELLDFSSMWKNTIQYLKKLQGLKIVSTKLFPSTAYQGALSQKGQGMQLFLRLSSLLTQNFKKEMIISRRSTYQSILAMEKDGVQVVERDLVLPVDVIISASMCLAWYDCTNIGKKATPPDEASSSVPLYVDEIAANVLTSLSFTFSSCIVVFEGDTDFLFTVMESSDVLYAAATSLDIELQIFFSSSSDLTKEIIISCIGCGTNLTKYLIPKLPESEPLAESFLPKFRSINPLTAHAILSTVGLLVELFERYGELEESKSGMTDCSSSVSSAPISENHEGIFTFERQRQMTAQSPSHANDLDPRFGGLDGLTLVADSMARPTENFLRQLHEEKGASPYGATPLSKAIYSAEGQQGSPWTIEFPNRVREKTRSFLLQQVEMVAKQNWFGATKILRASDKRKPVKKLQGALKLSSYLLPLEVFTTFHLEPVPSLIEQLLDQHLLGSQRSLVMIVSKISSSLCSDSLRMTPPSLSLTDAAFLPALLLVGWVNAHDKGHVVVPLMILLPTLVAVEETVLPLALAAIKIRSYMPYTI